MQKIIKYYKEPLLVFGLSYLFFLLLLAQNFSGPHDSIYYLNGILGNSPLTNQSHLFYHYAAYLWYNTGHYFFPGVRDFYWVEAFSAFWGSAGLAVIYILFRERFYLGKAHAIISLLPIAFSYGYWFYSINIEVYTPPMFFLLATLYILSRKELTGRDWYFVFLLHSFSILFHQINILFFPIIMIRLWQHRHKFPFLRWVMRYAMIGIVLVGGAYFISGWFFEGENTLAKWIGWVLGYSKESKYWEPLTWNTPLNATYGFGHAFLGGHFIFQLGAISDFFADTLSSHSLNDELFIARNISRQTAMLLVIACCLLFVLMLILLFRFLRNYREARQGHPVIQQVLMATFGLYTLFFLFWMPENLEFWILQTVIFWMLVLGTLKKPLWGKIKPIWVSSLAAVLLFVINFFGSITWMQHLENDLYYKKVTSVQKVASEGDLVILQDKWVMGAFLNYFTKLEVEGVPINDSTRRSLDARVQDKLLNKHQVILLPESGVTQNHIKDTRYIDSLKRVSSDNILLVNKEIPEIWIIGKTPKQ